MAEEAKWYVVHTYSGYEAKVATNLRTIVENRGLQDQILDINVPTEIVTELRNGEKKEIERKLFPGYVLVKMVMSDESWFLVRNVRGCTGFVGPGGRPIPLTEEEIRGLGVEKRELVVNFEVGDTVRIVDGPFVGNTSIVKKIDLEKETVTVTVNFLGRETPTEVDLGQVEKVD